MNGLDFRTVDIKFTQGLDTHAQRKLVMAGKWDSLINYTLSEDGSLRRRDGWEAMIDGQTGNGLALYNNELLVVNGPALSSVSTASAPDVAVAVSGSLGYVDISKAEVRRSTGMQDTPDCASGNGYTCYVWREKSAANATVGVNCTLVDESTGTQILSNSALRTNAAVFGARVVFANNAFFIFYIQGTSLYCRVIATSSPGTVGGEVALITSASLGALNFDAAAFGSNSGVMVIYAWADGVTSVRTIEVIRTGTVPSINAGPTNLFTEANVPAATITALACAAFPNGTNAGGFVTSTGAAAQAGLAGVVIGTAYTVTTAAAQLDPEAGATTANCHLCATQDSTRLRVFRDFVSEWSTNVQMYIKGQVVDTALATFAGPTQLIPSNTYGAGVTARGPQGPFIHGKGFTTGGRIFLPVYVASVYAGLGLSTSNPRNQNTQNTFFVLDTGSEGTNIAQIAPVVAKALYGTYGVASINGTAPAIGTPCSSPQASSGNFATVSGELTLLVLSSAAANNVSPTGLVRLTMTPQFTRPLLRTQLGESGYFAGGSLSTYDGAAVVEHGFPLYPEGVGITVNGAGTGAMTAGVHQVCFVYEWVDNAGQRHQSAPSPAVQVTVLATGSLTCEIPTLLLSQKTNIQVVPFMTQAGGVNFNRVLLNNGAYTPLLNSTAANIVTFTIDDADATIAGNELLYTQPNQGGTTLANVAPGPAKGLAVSQSRLWFFRADQPFEFGYSQEYIRNVGLQFSPDLGGLVPSDSGDGVGVATLDEKTVLLCAEKLYVVYGNGPTPGGGFNNFSKPQEIPSDVGCSEARSILRMPNGIIFKSRKGWYMLGRDLSVRYIGAGVARYDGNTVSSAVLIGDQQECRFSSADSEGPTLVYSYEVDQWSVFFPEETSLRAQRGNISDAVWWPTSSRYVHLHSSSAVFPGLFRDTPGVYVDASGDVDAYMALTVARTAWLHVGALEAFQRIRWLLLSGTAADPANPNTTMQISVDFDDVYGNAAPGSYTFSVAFGGITFTTNGPIDIRHKLRRQKCKSVAFTFTEVGTSTERPLTGIQALALEVGLKRGLNKLPAAQTVG